MVWIQLRQEKIERWTRVSTVMNLNGFKKDGEFPDQLTD
jgi:hypothetical protein